MAAGDGRRGTRHPLLRPINPARQLRVRRRTVREIPRGGGAAAAYDDSDSDDDIELHLVYYEEGQRKNAKDAELKLLYKRHSNSVVSTHWESNIAALLTGLIDGSQDSSDYTNYGADYSADVFETCRADGNKRNDVTDFIWCLENPINAGSHNSGFPRGPAAPSSVSEEASEPNDCMTLSVGDSLIVTDVETLFFVNHPLTYTAASSDSTVTTVLVEDNDRLKIRGVGPGRARVSITGTKRPISSTPNGPLERSTTRTATVTGQPGNRLTEPSTSPSSRVFSPSWWGCRFTPRAAGTIAAGYFLAGRNLRWRLIG